MGRLMLYPDSITEIVENFRGRPHILFSSRDETNEHKLRLGIILSDQSAFRPSLRDGRLLVSSGESNVDRALIKELLD